MDESSLELQSFICTRKAIVKSVRIIEEYSFFYLPGKLFAKFLKRKCHEIVESKLEDGQCGFCQRRRTTDQIFTLRQIFEKSWEYAKNVFTCFVDLEKVYDPVPRDKLWIMLLEHGIDGHLVVAIKSL